jgi:antitoxin component YwqK of YwqJK toxin-antitoxin module
MKQRAEVDARINEISGLLKRTQEDLERSENGEGYTSWFENRQKKNELTLKDGELDGKLTVWYENGQIEFESSCKYGELDGKWTYYNKDGTVKGIEGH